MKTVILTAREDNQFGGIGLHIEGMKEEGTNPAAEGLQVAHDLIEHVNGLDAIGDICDELEALGAIWFVRGQFSDIRRNSNSAATPHESLASDVVRMFTDFRHGAHIDLTVPRTKACVADDDFREVIRIALESTRDEINPEVFDAEKVAKLETKYMAVCFPRMRRGYRKAQKKYGKGTTANNLFWAVADAVQQLLPSRVFWSRNMPKLEAGQQWKLTYGFDAQGNADARVDEYYPGDAFEEG